MVSRFGNIGIRLYISGNFPGDFFGNLLTNLSEGNIVILLVKEQIYFQRDVHPKVSKTRKNQNDGGNDRMIVGIFD